MNSLNSLNPDMMISDIMMTFDHKNIASLRPLVQVGGTSREPR